MLGYFDLKLIVCNEACGAKLYAGIDKGPHGRKKKKKKSSRWFLYSKLCEAKNTNWVFSMDANVGITPEMIYFNLYAISYFPDKKQTKTILC